MDARAAGLHACAERLCSFFAAVATELEAHEEREAAIDEAGELRVSTLQRTWSQKCRVGFQRLGMALVDV